ncbi:MAG: methyltransferase domain-containing protein [Myxococcota bacterium]
MASLPGGPAALPTLICPACRHVTADGLHVRTLDAVDGLLRCACGAAHPVVDGVPLLFRDLDGWLAGEGAEALRRSDLPSAVTERIVAGAGGALARNDALVDVYARSRDGELQDWLRRVMGALSGDVLEMGAGLGACERSDVVALDHNLALVRRHPGRRVCGDAADPPFLPEQFDAVVLANVLDSCADPGLVLGQANALLKPGGTLVVTCAYAFQDAITPRSRRFAPSDLAAALDGRGALGGYGLPHRLVEDVDAIPWPLRVSGRLRHVHAVHALISRKAG